MPRTRRTPPVSLSPSVSQMEQAIQAKFDRLEALRTQIAAAKTLYAEHDALMAELLHLFILRTPDNKFIVNRSYTIGNKTYHYTPSFFDPTRNALVAKQWRSGAFPSGAIEG